MANVKGRRQKMKQRVLKLQKVFQKDRLFNDL